MLTVLLYVLVVAFVGAALFFAASAVFGRGEALAPIAPGTTATVLPATDLTGTDVRDLRFQQTARGYKMGEVDWALDRLAREIDELRARLDEYESATASGGSDPDGAGTESTAGSAGADTSGDTNPGDTANPGDTVNPGDTAKPDDTAPGGDSR